MALRVNVVCRNPAEDRIIPRMARALASRLGWTLTAAPDPCADVYYLSGYFEVPLLGRKWDRPVAAYFTHREEEPPGNAKARLFDAMAERVQLRIVTAAMYGREVAPYGPTVQCAAPLERDRFVIAPAPRGNRPVVGLSGYTYSNKRKGEDLLRGLLGSEVARRVEWRASGRGWPVPTRRYKWADMPAFYQGLDVLVCTSRVEGVPMPPLEALACGVRVVIPRGVGLLDELPGVPGIYRYERGDLSGLLEALERAAFPGEPIEREALRAVTAPYSVAAWCDDHRRAFKQVFEGDAQGGGTAGIDERAAPPAQEAPTVKLPTPRPTDRGTGSKRGIYCVAFGAPARESAMRLLSSIKRHMPDIPVALCAASTLGLEDVLITCPDSDVGARRAKLAAYDLAPAEWQTVLYLDADTEVVAPIYPYFEWIEDGWEFVICKDPSQKTAELAETSRALGAKDTLVLNGGVWAFARNERVAAFFRRWQAEWEKHAQRDQPALLRALYADPLKVLVLGNEWNTFPKYSHGVTTAGLMHYPGEARRWDGQLPGRIDSAEAWRRAEAFEKRRAGDERNHRSRRR